MTFKVPKAGKALWRSRVSLALLVLVIADSLLLSKFKSAVFIVILPILAVIWILLLIYTHLFLKSFTLQINSSAAVAKFGVFIKSQIILPNIRYVFVQSYTTPLAGLFKVRALVLAGVKTRIFVPEIGKEDAEKIIELLNSEKEV